MNRGILFFSSSSKDLYSVRRGIFSLQKDANLQVLKSVSPGLVCSITTTTTTTQRNSQTQPVLLVQQQQQFCDLGKDLLHVAYSNSLYRHHRQQSKIPITSLGIYYHRYSTSAGNNAPSQQQQQQQQQKNAPEEGDKEVQLVEKKPLGLRIKNGLVATGVFLISPSRWGPACHSAWDKMKEEGRHYWAGTKAMATEVSISYRILRQITQGHTPSRREIKQLKTTMIDLLRLVPFSVFIIVPFMELLLPVALALFPGMLPSTFQTKLKKNEEMRRQLRVKIEVAKFLQSTVLEMASSIKDKSQDELMKKKAKLFQELILKIQKGENVSNEEIISFTKLFSDELTLDNISRPQLVNMCKLLGLRPFGTDTILRYSLEAHIRSIKKDDITIINEGGVESLTLSELQEACATRGMRGIDMSLRQYQKAMNQWLDLSLRKGVPISLLILSRAFVIHDKLSLEEALTATIQTMPDDVVKTVEYEATQGDRKVSAEKKLEHVKRQQELLEEEWEDRKKKGEETKKKDEGVKATNAAAASTAASTSTTSASTAGVSTATSSTTTAAASSTEAQPKTAKPTVAATAPPSSATPQDASVSADATVAATSTTPSPSASTATPSASASKPAAAAAEAKPSKVAEPAIAKDAVEQAELDDRVEELAQALKVLTSESATVIEREEMDEMIQKQSEMKEDTGKSAAKLQNYVNKLLNRLSDELTKTEQKIGSSMRLLDVDRDGIISAEEIDQALIDVLNVHLTKPELDFVLSKIDPDGDGKVQLEELGTLVAMARRQRDEELGLVSSKEDVELLQKPVPNAESDQPEPQSQPIPPASSAPSAQPQPQPQQTPPEEQQPSQQPQQQQQQHPSPKEEEESILLEKWSDKWEKETKQPQSVPKEKKKEETK